MDFLLIVVVGLLLGAAIEFLFPIPLSLYSLAFGLACGYLYGRHVAYRRWKRSGTLP